MDWTQGPFTPLRNMFPQVDVRIIKATILDHGDDIESAIDFIINEVLGCGMDVNKLAGLSSGTPSTISDVSISDTANELEVVKNPPSSTAGEITEVDCNGHEESIVWLSEVMTRQPHSPTSSLSCINKDDAIGDKVDQICVLTGSSTLFGQEERGRSPRHEFVSEGDHFFPSVDVIQKHEIIIPSEKSASLFSVDDNDVFQISEARVEEGLKFNSNNLQTFEEQFRQSTSQTLLDSAHADQDRVSSYASSFSGLEDSFQHSEDSNYHGFNLEKKSWDKSSLEKNNEFIQFSNKAVDSCSHFQAEDPLSSSCEDGATWGTASSSSNYNISIDLLDEVVKEAKGDKEFLMKAIDEINALRFKADQEEAAAREAKVDAAQAGQDILKKAEELRQTVARMRASNELGAGEVFGEKAVLATEARELRLRLAQLKAQKLQATTFLNDIRTGLQERYESASKDRGAAEEEKRRMKLSAEKVLAMEEALLTKEDQESMDLEAEAEACRRLRKFLVEQGSFVDSLQGEVSVLFEDVEMLKKQIEEGGLSASSGFFSITRYLRAAEGAYGLTSSNSSYSVSNQELPIVSSTESQPIAESSGSVFLSSQVGMSQELSADSGLHSSKSFIPASLSCHGSNASGPVHSTASQIVNSLDGDDTISPLALTGSALGTEDSDAETTSYRGGMAGYYELHGLDIKNLNMFESTNTTSTNIKGGCSDDDSWHILAMPAKEDGLSSRSSSFVSVGIQQLHDIIWETT